MERQPGIRSPLMESGRSSGDDSGREYGSSLEDGRAPGDVTRLDDDDVEESQLRAPSNFIWALTVVAGVSGLLFGYDTGVISSTLVSIGTDLSSRPLSTLDKSAITSCTSLGALLASPVSGVLTDSLGRKRVLLIADFLFIVGALWQVFTTTVSGMVVGRTIVGLAVGGASFVAPLYISELAPSPFRGRLVTIVSLFITGGQVVAYIVGWLFSETVAGWRWMVGLGALPAVVQCVSLTFMPESPRWLVKSGLKERAAQVLGKVYGSGMQGDNIVRKVLRRVELEVLEEEEATARRRAHADDEVAAKRKWFSGMDSIMETFDELVGVGGNRRALTIACMLQGLQQLCGFNSIMYFSATIFQLVGFSSPTLTSLSIATTNFLFTLVAFSAIDRIGRRRILLYSVPIMIVGLALCSVAFNFLNLDPSSAGSAGLDAPVDDIVASKGVGPWATIILVAMIVYVAGYAIGLGNVPWQQSELFPLPVRSLGSGIATATNWGSNFIIGLTFLPLMEAFAPTGTFAAYTFVCVAGWFAIYRIYPETAGLNLEEVGGLLANGWGVKESMQRRRRT
ncbi:general substrate transporter [Lineolata rhizophorae]|uniref:General substrate transporter n=1 Tax=Lineolata rhizophorae TaxID=578093 RepID=A0A6A6NX96_9PEZI|nr:general substrate transporter [Lineolata rhizophorae]